MDEIEVRAMWNRYGLIKMVAKKKKTKVKAKPQKAKKKL